MKLSRALHDHSGRICLAIALALALIFSVHMAAQPIVPIADGAGYIARAFALYGFLHTGQWSAFAHLLGRPVQSVLPLHDILFFLLPQAPAGQGSYYALQSFTTWLLLAYGIHKICAMLDRPEWAPGLLLFVAVNNVALTDFYAFYLDMPFLALSVVALGWQLAAWRESRDRAALLAGVALGALFWTKPANALIFIATFVLAELMQAGAVLHTCSVPPERVAARNKILRRWGAELLGFAPLSLLALATGAGQVILQLIDRNEVGGASPEIEIGGLLRLFYFPFCFSALYHLLVLVGLVAVAFSVGRWMLPRFESGNAPPFPARLFVPILIAAVIFGEFFSFWMLVKPMRAMLPVLPVVALAFCWFWEKRRLRPELLFLIALAYATVAFAQKSFDLLGTRDQLVEDNYQLTWSSWTEMPSPWHGQRGLMPIIHDSIAGDLPTSGIVCVNSVEIRDLMAWSESSRDLLAGRPPACQWRYLFNYKGDYYVSSLVGASRIVLFTFFPAQSNRATWLSSNGLIAYAQQQWGGSPPRATFIAMPSLRDQPLGYIIAIDPPLTQDDVDQLNVSAALYQSHKADGDGSINLDGRYYSSAEAWNLLSAWAAKRFEF